MALKHFIYCLFALIGGTRISHAINRDCTAVTCEWNPSRPEIRAYRAQGYQSCMESLKRKTKQMKDCVTGAINRVMEQQQCLCPGVPVNALLSGGLVRASQIRMHSMVTCADYSDLMASQSCPQSVKDCVQTAWTLHGTVSMLRGQHHDGTCDTGQRAQVDKLIGCARNVKSMDLSGCGVWRGPIEKMAPIVNITLPLVCAGCNVQSLVRQCMVHPPQRRTRPRQIPGPCQVKVNIENIVGCLHKKMGQNQNCRNLVVPAKQAWAKVKELGMFRALDEGCQMQQRYEAATATLRCSHMRKKREATDEADLRDIFLNLF